jgi:hypothetical protein
MRRTTIGILGLSALAVAGCGGSKPFANQPRPPAPVNLTVYVNNDRVSISPASVGAGPVVLIVTNQASNAESLAVAPSNSGGQPLADTGPINPQGTAAVTVDFTPGTYTVATNASGTTEASLASTPGVRPALLHVGPTRASASSQLLEP